MTELSQLLRLIESQGLTAHGFTADELDQLARLEQAALHTHLPGLVDRYLGQVEPALGDKLTRLVADFPTRDEFTAILPGLRSLTSRVAVERGPFSDPSGRPASVPPNLSGVMEEELATTLSHAQATHDHETLARLHFELYRAAQGDELREYYSRQVRSTGLDYFDRLHRRPGVERTTAHNTKVIDHTLAIKGNPDGGNVAKRTRATTTGLIAALGAFFDGNNVELGRHLAAITPAPQIQAADFDCFVRLYNLHVLQNLYQNAQDRGDARGVVVANALLVIEFNLTLQDLWLDHQTTRPPALHNFDKGRWQSVINQYVTRVSLLIDEIYRHGTYPIGIDWTNFFNYLDALAKKAPDSFPNYWPTLTAYWAIRFGRTFYVMQRGYLYGQEQLQQLDALLPQLRNLRDQGVISADVYQDAVDFRSRAGLNAHYASPVTLFAARGAQKKATASIQVSVDTLRPPAQDQIQTVGRQVLLSGGMMALSPATWVNAHAIGNTLRRWFNPLRWPQRFVHAEQDRVTAKLSKRSDLLHATMSFVDVLPRIEHDDAEIIRHFREYFPATDPDLPWHLNLAIRLSKMKWVPQTLMAKAMRRGVHIMAHRYIAGENLHDATKKIVMMVNEGRGVIFDAMGEAISSEAEADAYLGTYLNIIGDLERNPSLIEKMRLLQKPPEGVRGFAPFHQADTQMAIKFSGLLPIMQWDATDPEGTAERVKVRFRKLLDRIVVAQRCGLHIRLTIDPEEFEYRDITLKILKEVLMEDAYLGLENVGIAVQCYLKDSLAIIEDLARWSKARGALAEQHGWTTPGQRGRSIPIRLVKGAYWDAENFRHHKLGYPLPVFSEKWMSDVNYEKTIDLVLSRADHLRAAIASHNVRSLAYAISQAQKHHRPMEVQMLYGMAPDTEAALVAMGIPVWMYTPMGKLLPSMAYLARRILENASQSSFLLQRLKGANLDDLLRDPTEGHDVSIWPPPEPQQPLHGVRRVTDLDSPFRNEPLVDYANWGNLETIKIALARLSSLFAKRELTSQAIINGKTYRSGSYYPQMFASSNPSKPSELITRSYNSRGEAVKAAVAAARAGLPAWHHPLADQVFETPHQRVLAEVRERAQRLLTAAGLMRAERMELTAVIMKETGKPVREADADVAEAIDFLEYYARQAVAMVRDNPHLILSPKGVSAVIPPWNFPLAIATGMTAASLVMGNTVVLKPAPQSTYTAHLLVDLLHRAGIPKEALQFLPGDRQTGEELRQQDGVRLTAFTGSMRAGLTIYEQDAPRGIQLITEMGGKNAMIIGPDAHPDDVIKFVLHSKFGYAGQKCSALDRLIIVGDETHYRELVDRLVEAARTLQVGDVTNFGNNFGPVIDETAYERIHHLIAAANGEVPWDEEKQPRAMGHLLLDGRREQKDGDGYFIGPTIFEVIDVTTSLFQEENFAPVLAIKHAATLEEAIQIAEKSVFGLTGGFVSRSPSDIATVENQWHGVGNLYLNREQTGALNGRNPFGGTKLSGLAGSKAGGEDYLWQFVDVSLADNSVQLNAAKLFQVIGGRALHRVLTAKQYQPELPGEENRVIHRPRGTGWIVVDQDSTLEQLVGLVSAGLHSGNNLFITMPPSQADQKTLLRNLLASMRYLDSSATSNQDEWTIRIPATGAIQRIFFADAPASTFDKKQMAQDPQIKWLAFASPQAPDTEIMGYAAQTPSGQDFVRPLITSDVRTLDPNMFVRMTIPRTITTNTVRHGFDAKASGKSSRPRPTPLRIVDGPDSGTRETGRLVIGDHAPASDSDDSRVGASAHGLQGVATSSSRWTALRNNLRTRTASLLVRR